LLGVIRNYKRKPFTYPFFVKGQTKSYNPILELMNNFVVMSLEFVSKLFIYFHKSF